MPVCPVGPLIGKPANINSLYAYSRSGATAALPMLYECDGVARRTPVVEHNFSQSSDARLVTQIYMLGEVRWTIPNWTWPARRVPLPQLPPPARIGDAWDQVDTPCLVLDLDAFEHNLRAMQDWADRCEVALRPHAKAHKCPEVACSQAALGARGICVQKVGEALPLRRGRHTRYPCQQRSGRRNEAGPVGVAGQASQGERVRGSCGQCRRPVARGRPAWRAHRRAGRTGRGTRPLRVSSPIAALGTGTAHRKPAGAALRRPAGLSRFAAAPARPCERATAVPGDAATARSARASWREHDYACPITGSGTGTAEFDAPGRRLYGIAGGHVCLHGRRLRR